MADNLNKEINGNDKGTLRILVYVCPECKSILKDNGMINRICRKKKLHGHEKPVSMKLGELFVKL